MADDFDSLFEPTEEDLERVGIVAKPRSAADFPFDPTLRIEDLEGLEKLRAVEDRALAQKQFEKFVELEKWWSTEDAERDRERSKRKREDREVAIIVPRAHAALKGDISLDAKLLVERVLFPQGYVPLNRTMLPALREFARGLVELKKAGKA